MAEKSILIISHGHFENKFLEAIAEDVRNEFHHPVSFEESHVDLSEFYDPMRRQYNGNELLREIDSSHSSGFIKAIGIFRVDLFIPILTYIFGQAIFRGNSGIASIYRLRNEQYGMKKNDALLMQRFSKVVIHELGHTFGLTHCLTPNCVMRSSTYVEDIDQKDMQFCSHCRTLIQT